MIRYTKPKLVYFHYIDAQNNNFLVEELWKNTFLIFQTFLNLSQSF